MCKNKENTSDQELQMIPADQPTELVLIMQAIDKLGGANAESAVAVIKELSKMKREQERWDAEKEFYSQLSAFQQECPQIKKTKSTGKVTDAGGKFSFMYAPLDEVERTVRPHLQPLGFSFYWDGKTTKEDGEYVREITFHLLHRNGHRTKSSISAPITKEIGSMKGIQLFGAGESYLKRYTMLAGLGIPTTDNDGNRLGDTKAITKDQAADLESKCDELKVDKKKYLEFMGTNSFDGIRATDYKRAFGLLKQKESKLAKDGVA